MTFVQRFVNVMGMKKTKIAIVGLGHLGALHLKILSSLKNRVEIVGICDIKEGRTKRLASHYKIPYFKNYQDLANKIDCVDICVPTESHYPVAKFFLEKKVHAFVEKPITKTVPQATKLIALADKNNLKLQVGHVERFNSAFESIQHFTKQPLFIECHRLNPFPHRSLDIGVIMDLMIHDIDIILGIVPSKIKRIEAIGVNVLTPLEDIASARLTFENGCVCNLTASRVSDDVMRKIRIFQPNSYISLDYVKQEAFIYKKQGHRILKHALPIEKEQPLQKELEHFIDCVQNDKTPLVTGVAGKEALQIALKITQKAWNKKSISL